MKCNNIPEAHGINISETNIFSKDPGPVMQHYLIVTRQKPTIWENIIYDEPQNHHMVCMMKKVIKSKKADK